MPRGGDDPFDRDLEASLGEAAKPSLFLGVLREDEIRRAFARHGVDDRLAKMGLSPFTLSLDLSDPYAHRIRLTLPGGDVLVDSTVRRARRSLPGVGSFDALEIVWLELANPRAPFTTDRPALPGQRHPGLTLAREAFSLQRALARRVHAEAIVTTPRWFHNASLYLRAGYVFREKSAEQKFAEIEASIKGMTLAEASHLVDSRTPPVQFGELIYPLSPRLRAAF